MTWEWAVEKDVDREGEEMREPDVTSGTDERDTHCRAQTNTWRTCQS